MCMVFSLKKMSVYGFCFHMCFPNPVPIPILYPKHTGMGSDIYQYWYGGKTITILVRFLILVWGCLYEYGDISHMDINIYKFTLSYTTMYVKIDNHFIEYFNIKLTYETKPYQLNSHIKQYDNISF